MAKEKFNFEAIQDIGQNTYANVRARFGEVGPKIVFTANSDYKTHNIALNLVAPRGIVNLFGGVINEGANKMLDSNLIHYKELIVLGSHGSTPAQHREALRMLEDNEVNLERMITHKYSRANYSEALELAFSGSGLKVILG